MSATATETAELIPVTIHLRRDQVERIAAIAGRAGSNAAKEIERLVGRALENTTTQRRKAATPWETSSRPLNSITGGESMFMLAMHLEGRTPKEIGDYFHLSEEDARTHIYRLEHTRSNPRSRKPHAAPQG